jgi:hypothetical protein
MDLRVAIHFSVDRKLPFIDNDRDYKVIFMMRTDKVCYISPHNSWEAEVFKPAGDYYCKGYFIKENCEMVISRSIKNEIEVVNLLIIDIGISDSDKIKKLTPESLKPFIDDLYESSGIGEEATQAEIEGEDELTDYWKEAVDSLIERGIITGQEGGKRKRRKHRMTRRGRKTKIRYVKSIHVKSRHGKSRHVKSRHGKSRHGKKTVYKNKRR